MAKQRYINTKIWSDSWVSELDPVEKLLFLYILTNERTNIAGIYELPIKIMSIETGIEKQMIENILNRFKKDKRVEYFNGWVVIANFVKHQDIGNLKIIQGINSILRSIPQSILDTLSIPYIYPSNYSNSNSNSNSNTTANAVPIKTNYKMKTINIETGEYEKLEKPHKRQDIIKLATLFDKMASNYTGKPIITPRSYFIILNAINIHKMKPIGITALFEDWFKSKIKNEDKVKLSFALSANNINAWKTKN